MADEQPAHLPQVWVGTAKTVITPPVGVDLCGFVARTAPMAGVHDDLYARAIVWSSTSESTAAVVLVVLDLLDLTAHTVAAIRAQATAQTGIPGERIGVACTHTHGGPATLGWAGLGRVDQAWLDQLPALAGTAVAQAAQQLAPMLLSVACGAERTVGQNRRIPNGVTDPDLPVVRLQRPEGTVAAILCSYACHPVTVGPGNLLATGDYPGQAVRTLEAMYPGAMALFATGCCGQINTGHTARDGVAGRGQQWRTHGEAQRLGRMLAGEAVRAAEGMARGPVAHPTAPYPLQPVLVAAQSCRVTLPLLPAPTPAELTALETDWQAARERLRAEHAPQAAVAPYDVWLAWASAVRNGEFPTTVTAEVQVLTLGEVALVLLPGEMFVEFGLAIKERVPGRTIITIAYANGTPGYIPHRSAYPAGGYEVADAFRYYGAAACYAPEAGEAVVDAAVALLTT